MKRLTFKQQLLCGIILVILGNSLAFAFHKGIFANIAWIVYGVLFIVNPVYPDRLKHSLGERKAKRSMRITGMICIIIGLLTRFDV